MKFFQELLRLCKWTAYFALYEFLWVCKNPVWVSVLLSLFLCLLIFSWINFVCGNPSCSNCFILFYFVTMCLDFLKILWHPHMGNICNFAINKLFHVVIKQDHQCFHPVFPLPILFQTQAKVEFICKRINSKQGASNLLLPRAHIIVNRTCYFFCILKKIFSQN